MITYYKEENGDYLGVNKDVANRQFESILGAPQYEARVTGTPGELDSVYTTGVSKTYLDQQCTPVEPEDVPEEWLEAIDYEQEPVAQEE